jgi:hypothetical protein
VPSVPLPDDPSLEQLRKQAKDLRDLAGAGVPGALELVAAHHPGADAVTLTGAQLVVARHYGFASWARLKQHMEMIERYRRSPDEVDETTGLADEFLALACLRYGGDDAPDRWERAARLLAEHPALVRASIHVAAAAADEPAVRAHLAADPALASREGGPYRWPPILYLAYARHDPYLSAGALLGTARTLLDHGADPNAGYLWHGLYPPFTALTGAIPVAGGLVYGPLIYRYAREARGHGVPEVMIAVAGNGGRIRPQVSVVKALASALCIGTGGSVGREGRCRAARRLGTGAA